MSGHPPPHHHHPSQGHTSYSYPAPPPSTPGYPSASSHSGHAYHTAHPHSQRQSLSGSQSGHTNGHVVSSHPSGPANLSSSHRHGSAHMPPPSTVQQQHHHHHHHHPQSHHSVSVPPQQNQGHQSSHSHSLPVTSPETPYPIHHSQHPSHPSSQPAPSHHSIGHARATSHSRDQALREYHPHPHHPTHPHPHIHPSSSQHDREIQQRSHPHSSQQQQQHSPADIHMREHPSHHRDSHHNLHPRSHSLSHANPAASHQSSQRIASPGPTPLAHHSPHPHPPTGTHHSNPSGTPATIQAASHPLSVHGPLSNGTSNGISKIAASHTHPGPPPGPPTLPAGSSGGGPTGRQLAQPPPQSGTLGNGHMTEEAMVAAILRDGETSLHKSSMDWRPPTNPAIEKLVKETESTWIAAGTTSESLGNYNRAVDCYERALKHNPLSVSALTKAAGIYRHQEDFRRAANYFSRLLKIHEGSGEIWGALGHCYLMVDELPMAYTSYQQALHHFQTPKSEPKLWYGIGILYDRYGSLEHAEEAFRSVIKMDPNFEKANEIYFRLGIIYKQQRKASLSLECFQWILDKPPSPLTEIDIWFQIGHVHEQQGNLDQAKEAYERVLSENANHAKVLQQLGGLYCREGSSFYDLAKATTILARSLEVDSSDSFSWYLLGRVNMTSQNYNKAYESYQQAVYRDGKNPAFWCSIGVLYYAISQYHDSLDAYSRAIRINPYLSEVWFNLGALYESCHDQMPDAIDAYQRAAQLDANNSHITRRLTEIQRSKDSGAPLGPPPTPRDMSHTSANWPFPNALNGPPDASFGNSSATLAGHEDIHRHPESPASPMARSHPTSVRPTSPSHPPAGRSSVVARPGTASSAAGVRPQSSGQFSHGPPPSQPMASPSDAHHLAHSAPHYGYPAGSHSRRQSGGHSALAPMDLEPSPRLGPRGGPQLQHNLPHIRSVVDSHSRTSSPGPVAPEAIRRGPTLSNSGLREMASPKTSPPMRSSQVPGPDRLSYAPHNPTDTVMHPGGPPVYPRYPSGTQSIDDVPYSQNAGPSMDPLNRDRERDRKARDTSRFRPTSPDYRSGSHRDRAIRSPPAPPQAPVPYLHRGGDHGSASVGYPMPLQAPRQSYEPRHSSPRMRGASAPRFSPEQLMAHSPTLPNREHRSGHPPPNAAGFAEERRPSSQSGYQSSQYSAQAYSQCHHPLSGQQQQPPRRYDPRYDEPHAPLQRHSGNMPLEHVSPPRPRSAAQRSNEDERQKTLNTSRNTQPSPTPSIAASEFSVNGGNGANGGRRGPRAKQAIKDEDYPVAPSARRRKPLGRSGGNSSVNNSNVSLTMPNTSSWTASPAPALAAPPPTTATALVAEAAPIIKEKKERKKVANTKVKGMRAKVNESSKGPSPSPAPPNLSTNQTPNRAIQNISPPPPVSTFSLPDRKADEEYSEYDEVADTLLNLAGQPPRRAVHSQPSPPVGSPHSASVPTATGRSVLTGSSSGKGGTIPRGSVRQLAGGNAMSSTSGKPSPPLVPAGSSSGSGRSPSVSSHSAIPQGSPNPAGSSPESVMNHHHLSNHVHAHNANNGSTQVASISSNTPDSAIGRSSRGILSGGAQNGSALSPNPAGGFSKRVRGDESSPNDGEAGPEPKRSRPGGERAISSGQPSPHTHFNNEGRSTAHHLGGPQSKSSKPNAGGRATKLQEEARKDDRLVNASEVEPIRADERPFEQNKADDAIRIDVLNGSDEEISESESNDGKEEQRDGDEEEEEDDEDEDEEEEEEEEEEEA